MTKQTVFAYMHVEPGGITGVFFRSLYEASALGPRLNTLLTLNSFHAVQSIVHFTTKKKRGLYSINFQKTRKKCRDTSMLAKKRVPPVRTDAHTHTENRLTPQP